MTSSLLRLALVLVACCPAFAQDGKALFASFCAACHMTDRMHVGPSLVRVRWRGSEQGLFAVDRVRVTGDGFELRFTEPVDERSLGEVKVRAHGYRYHKVYGSPKADDREVRWALG